MVFAENVGELKMGNDGSFGMILSRDALAGL